MKNENIFLSLSPDPAPEERGAGAEAPGLRLIIFSCFVQLVSYSSRLAGTTFPQAWR